jgi:hypothetical protein
MGKSFLKMSSNGNGVTQRLEVQGLSTPLHDVPTEGLSCQGTLGRDPWDGWTSRLVTTPAATSILSWSI